MMTAQIMIGESSVLLDFFFIVCQVWSGGEPVDYTGDFSGIGH